MTGQQGRKIFPEVARRAKFAPDCSSRGLTTPGAQQQRLSLSVELRCSFKNHCKDTSLTPQNGHCCVFPGVTCWYIISCFCMPLESKVEVSRQSDSCSLSCGSVPSSAPQVCSNVIISILSCFRVSEFPHWLEMSTKGQILLLFSLPHPYTHN